MPVVSEEKNPVAEGKAVAADVKPAVGEEKPAAAAETTSVDAKAGVDPKDPKVDPRAGAEPATAATADQSAAETTPVATATSPAASDITSAIGRASVEAKNPAPAEAKNAEPMPDIAAPALEKAKEAGQAASTDAGGPSEQASPSVTGSVAMVQPEQPAPKKEARDKAGIKTVGMLGCTHYRSYNPATKSYRGFDGRIYKCQ